MERERTELLLRRLGEHARKDDEIG